MYEVKRAKRSGVSRQPFFDLRQDGAEAPIYSHSQQKWVSEQDGHHAPSTNQHWLEYDFVAVVVLFVSIGFLALIVLSI
jgi:hypothetical protein